jgi:hypothetical protein
VRHPCAHKPGLSGDLGVSLAINEHTRLCSSVTQWLSFLQCLSLRGAEKTSAEGEIDAFTRRTFLLAEKTVEAADLRWCE